MNEEQRTYVETIKEKGLSLLDLISSLLDMSKIEAGALRLHLEDIDLGRLLQQAKTTIVPQAQKKSIEIDLDIEKDLGSFVADLERVRQCLVNLLGNAVKFTPKEGRISVKVRADRRPRSSAPQTGRFGAPLEDFIRFDVADTGIGSRKKSSSRSSRASSGR
ncbi:MAG: hypothetical protein HC923_10645, partial [Myxococcales bacterium]|nr:hypothetical protein [Myxococcales bacterium]